MGGGSEGGASSKNRIIHTTLGGACISSTATEHSLLQTLTLAISWTNISN